ncbi:MAG: hypothetical protein WA110_09070 [Anaerolineaceae bacterium]
MDDNIENKPEEKAEDSMKVSAEEWSQVPPAEPVSPVPPTETDRWGAPQPSASEDADRWTGELYTPESEPASGSGEPESGATETKSQKPEEPVIVDIPSNGSVPPFSTPPAQEKSKFPVWAIVLIVLLVIGLCVACPLILIFSGLVNWFQSSGLFLPLFI